MEHKTRVPWRACRFLRQSEGRTSPPSVDEVETADVDNSPLFLVAGAISDNQFDRAAPPSRSVALALSMSPPDALAGRERNASARRRRQIVFHGQPIPAVRELVRETVGERLDQV